MRKGKGNFKTILILLKPIDKIANIVKQHRKPVFINKYGPLIKNVYIYNL